MHRGIVFPLWQDVAVEQWLMANCEFSVGVGSCM